MNDNDLRKLLKSLKTIVMIGVSTSPIRASFFVARYFILRGVRIIPINPKKCPNSNIDSSEKFINWITSKEGQELINSYTKNGEQLFFGNSKKKLN